MNRKGIEAGDVAGVEVRSRSSGALWGIAEL